MVTKIIWFNLIYLTNHILSNGDFISIFKQPCLAEFITSLPLFIPLFQCQRWAYLGLDPPLLHSVASMQ